MDEARLSKLRPLVDKIAASQSADVLLYNAPIVRPFDEQIILQVSGMTRRANLVGIFVTEGGDGDAAYRIARCLQTYYKRFTLLVSGYCKSAGTIIALGAHEIAVTPNGELGPLDIQLAKQDDLWEGTSGLIATHALLTLQKRAFSMFERYAFDIKKHCGGWVTFKTAAEIASHLTTGLYAPVFEQMNPMYLGEVARAMSIAGSYGVRLDDVAQNLNSSALAELISAYPSHGFVIDKNEMERLFKNVRDANELEMALVRELELLALRPSKDAEGEDVPELAFLSSEHVIAEGGAKHEGATRDRDSTGESATAPGGQTVPSAGRADEEPSLRGRGGFEPEPVASNGGESS